MKKLAFLFLAIFTFLISAPVAYSQCNAAFAWEQVNGTYTIHFNNNSTSEHDIVSYSWTFGDNHTSDGENPIHTYDEPGTYLVCLIIEDELGCVSDVCHEVQVESISAECEASFMFYQIGGSFEVEFSDFSTSQFDIISWNWTFGDGDTSNDQNPSHTYDEAGTYVVCLIIEDQEGCVSDICHEVHVEGASSDCNADFTWDQVGGTHEVDFMNTSTSEHDIVSYNWTFGDEGTSDDQNPLHEYEHAGTYVVCLIIEDNAGCVSDVCHEVQVEAISSDCNAAFEWEQVDGTLEIHFINNSTSEHDIISWIWNFGDGHDSDDENPVHVYDESGTYLVCLILEDEFGCVSDVCHEVHVEGVSSDCNAAFEWEQVEGTFEIHFIDQSTSEHDIISWDWTFGDGGTSEAENPVHIYDHAGTYVVCIRIEDETGCVSELCHEVQVQEVSSDCNAAFEWEQVEGTFEIHFIDQSTSEHDIISWDWTFGDGGTSEAENPVHIYNHAGTYVVCIRIEDETGCVSELCHEVQVQEVSSDCNAAFEWEQVEGTFEIHFINQSTSEHDIISWDWTFGDGGTSEAENPVHIYDHAGTYVVCIRIEDETGCVSELCHEVHVEGPEGCNAAFEWEQVEGTFEIHFINQSTSEHDIISWHWTFGDGGASDDVNPVHIYNHAGTYVVCLRIEDETGCVSELCHEVHVEGPEECNAAFEWDQSGGFEVHFDNNSTSQYDIISWLWIFGDGDSSNLQNPVHVFPHAGTYVVCLIIHDANGCASDVCDEVEVEGPEECNAAFTWNQIGDTPEVHFTNTSTSEHDIVSWNWTFGDGHSSDDQNPTHTYDELGTYLVCLIIEDEFGCVSDVCHEVHLTEQGFGCEAEFSANQSEEGENTVIFTDESTSDGIIVSWNWDFGDGHTSQEQNPTHSYEESGIYWICLTITDDAGCMAQDCHEVGANHPLSDQGLAPARFQHSDDDHLVGSQIGGKNLVAISQHSSPLKRQAKGHKGQDEYMMSYPNPFVSFTTIQFELIHDADVEMEVYDMLGRKLIHESYPKEIRGIHYKKIYGYSFQPGLLVIKLTVNEKSFVKVITVVE